MSRLHSNGVLRRALTVLVVAAALLTGLAGVSDPSPTPPASTDVEPAADVRYFRPGNLISDNLFFDGDAMSVAAVQSFLNGKNPHCTAGAMPCLKDYTQTTSSRSGDAYCDGYRGAANETAATIIYKVGKSCGINQRALLVMLQKEQGLVRASGSSLTYRRYEIAMGYGCPDTAACDTLYYGFVNQLYNAARQFQRYATLPQNYGHQPFAWNDVYWSPKLSCGSSRVYIENKATAGLYNYTPYQPNAAALGAGYGVGDGCSAYGNRNFWLYYTDWFGSTQSPGGNAIVTRASQPGAATVLGQPTRQVICGLADDGCFQTFEKAAIYWSPSSGAQIVLGSIRSRWAALGWENGQIGYPIRDEICGLVGGGCFQSFQKGAIYWTPDTGAREILGSIRSKWAAQRWEKGPLGYPTTGELCGLRDGGCHQKFQGGSIYWSPATRSHTVLLGDVWNRWEQQKWETGQLGYPTTDLLCGLRDGGCHQKFEGGSIYTTPADQTVMVTTDVLDKWGTVQWENGTLGYPTGETQCGLPDGGCSTAFEHGAIYSSASTGQAIVLDAVRGPWTAQNSEQGPLGYPTGDTLCGLPGGGCRSEFQGGEITWTAGTGARVVSGPIRDRWVSEGRQSGALGYPSSNSNCGLVRGGCVQRFEGGNIYVTPSGSTRVVRSDVLAQWGTAGYENGQLGYPANVLACWLRDGGCVQRYEGGLIYVTPGSGVRTVWGAIRSAYDRAKWETGKLRYPVADEVCGLAGGGCVQHFQGGRIYYGPGTGAHVVLGAIGGAYVRSGAEAGPLSYPVRGELCGLVRGGCFQHFRNGSIYYTPSTGARLVTGAIRDYWSARGWERSALGYPIADAVTTSTEITQQFEGGTLVQNRSTGNVTVRP